MQHIVVMINTCYDHARRILSGIHAEAVMHPEWDILTFREEYPEPGIIRSWGASGIIGAFGENASAARYAELGIPIINVSSRPQSAPVINITADHVVIGSMAAHHLVEQGLNRFGMITRPGQVFSEKRRSGFMSRLGENCENLAEYALPKSLPESINGLCAWLDTLEFPIGVFAVGDMEARLALTAARLRGIDVPASLAVIGANNEIEICHGCVPAISSIDSNAEKIGCAAVQTLRDIFARKNVQDQLLPVGSLYARGSSDYVASIKDPVVRKAVDLMRAHLAEGIDVNSIAHRLKLSSKTLENHFHKALGRTPLAELHRIRLQHAKELLAGTQLSVNEISQLVGYLRSGHFITFFKKHAGCTPGGYRRSS